jgi:hypothetical protein
MASRTVETAVFLWGDRNAPASLTRAIEICSIVKGVSAAV